MFAELLSRLFHIFQGIVCRRLGLLRPRLGIAHGVLQGDICLELRRVQRIEFVGLGSDGLQHGDDELCSRSSHQRLDDGLFEAEMAGDVGHVDVRGRHDGSLRCAGSKRDAGPSRGKIQGSFAFVAGGRYVRSIGQRENCRIFI